MRTGTLSAVHLADGGPPRVAYAVPRAVGGAVVRNRARRRLRHVLATIAVADPGQVPGGALVITVRGDLADRSTKELTNDVVSLLEAVRARHRREATHP